MGKLIACEGLTAGTLVAMVGPAYIYRGDLRIGICAVGRPDIPAIGAVPRDLRAGDEIDVSQLVVKAEVAVDMAKDPAISPSSSYPWAYRFVGAWVANDSGAWSRADERGQETMGKPPIRERYGAERLGVAAVDIVCGEPLWRSQAGTIVGFDSLPMTYPGAGWTSLIRRACEAIGAGQEVWFDPACGDVLGVTIGDAPIEHDGLTYSVDPTRELRFAILRGFHMEGFGADVAGLIAAGRLDLEAGGPTWVILVIRSASAASPPRGMPAPAISGPDSWRDRPPLL